MQDGNNFLARGRAGCKGATMLEEIGPSPEREPYRVLPDVSRRFDLTQQTNTKPADPIHSFSYFAVLDCERRRECTLPI